VAQVFDMARGEGGRHPSNPPGLSPKGLAALLYGLAHGAVNKFERASLQGRAALEQGANVMPVRKPATLAGAFACPFR
jgi:hypothetical protein